MFNDANLGGFVAYFAPRLRTFIDDRVELLTERRNAGIPMRGRDIADPSLFDEWQRRWGFRLAIVDPRTQVGAESLAASRPERMAAGGVYVYLGAIYEKVTP